MPSGLNQPVLQIASQLNQLPPSSCLSNWAGAPTTATLSSYAPLLDSEPTRAPSPSRPSIAPGSPAPESRPMANAKKYPLVVAQYNLRSHPTRTEHWNVAILESRERAHIYELAGNTDTFHYEYKVVSNFARSSNFRGGCYVGSITEDKVAWLNEKLREVTIVLHNPDFDAQTWVINAVRHLKGEEGVVIEEVRERVIRAELELEKDRWDAVEDTIEDRLFHKPRREMGPVVYHSANPKISEQQQEKTDGGGNVPEQSVGTEAGTGESSDGGKAVSEIHEK